MLLCLAAARAEAEPHAAVAAVQAGVDVRRAEAMAAVQAESEVRMESVDGQAIIGAIRQDRYLVCRCAAV